MNGKFKKGKKKTSPCSDVPMDGRSPVYLAIRKKKGGGPPLI
jgi:hypothetical protein